MYIFINLILILNLTVIFNWLKIKYEKKHIIEIQDSELDIYFNNLEKR